MIRATLDTNIIISGLNFPRGNPARILQMAAEGQFEAVVSDPILEEVDRILQRVFKWTPGMADEAVSTIRSIATHVTPTETLAVVERDPDDDRIVEAAVASKSQFIVTGDKDLLSLGSFRDIRIMSAAQFLGEFQARGRV